VNQVRNGSHQDERPLSARSVVASILLGTRPPELPGRLLVRAGALFDIAEGTVRVALSRMVAAGELQATGDGRYRLAGPLLSRRARQDQSRNPPSVAWDGTWITAVVTVDGRSAADRATLRDAMGARRMGELREGVWLRPDNLGAGLPAGGLERDHCTWLRGRPVDDPGALAGQLWDLRAYGGRTATLLDRMAATIGRLREGDPGVLGPCFVTAASALRHLTADPLLPGSLVGPDWNGDRLRSAYDDYEAALQAGLRHWFRAQSS
jgi:phenylacetic acid degradation operon negative regulatory protein